MQGGGQEVRTLRCWEVGEVCGHHNVLTAQHPNYFFLFTSCFTSSFPIGLAAEMMTAAVPSRNAGIVQRTTTVPSEAVLPRKITRGGSTVEITLTSIDAAGMALCERLFLVATRTSTAVPE